MSIRQKICQLVADGQLLVWEPAVASEPTRRYLFVTSEVWDEIHGNVWNNSMLSHRYGLLRRDFDRFVTGEDIEVGLDPYAKADSAFLARIHPVEVGIWTLRSRAPLPSIRVFCSFSEPDTLVAMRTELREDLDGPGGVKWMRAREHARAIWDDMMMPEKPLEGNQANDFVTENAFAV